jgi:hypothetical protein
MAGSDQPVKKIDGVEIFNELASTFGILPEVIGAGELNLANSVLAGLLKALRHSVVLRQAGQDRDAALLALRSVSLFIVRLKPGFDEDLYASFRDLASALVALNEGNVTALVQPTQAKAGGRAPDSPMRQVLIGFAVGAVGRLQWTGLRVGEAHKAVADTLHKHGVRPSRGSGRMTARSVREWCERVAADVGGRSIATLDAKLLLTPEREKRIKSMPPEDARKFVLHQLTLNVRMNVGATTPRKAT